MKRIWLGVAAMAALSACSGGGGNPFATETEVEDTEGIPADLTANLESISYDANAQTLTVTGIALDDTPIDAVYNRRPALDRAGYEAYTIQDSSLDRHSTAFVRDIDGARASVIVTGVQFEHYFRGTVYARSTGAYNPPEVTATTGLVSYAGGYIGLVNGPGEETDLLPVAVGTDPDITPNQAAQVVGKTFINADFAQNTVNGAIYDRELRLRSQTVNVATISMEPSTIDPTTGSFAGNLTLNLQDKGTYGGIFGGTDASAVAGTVFIEDHFDGFENEEEYGMFVLRQCGTPGADPVCNQPVP